MRALFVVWFKGGFSAQSMPLAFCQGVSKVWLRQRILFVFLLLSGYVKGIVVTKDHVTFGGFFLFEDKELMADPRHSARTL